MKFMKTITDKSIAPFETYLYVEMDNGYLCEAYEIEGNDLLDLKTLLDQAYPDFDIEINDHLVTGSPNYAAIITDDRAPDLNIVWTSCDFYIEINY